MNDIDFLKLCPPRKGTHPPAVILGIKNPDGTYTTFDETKKKDDKDADSK
jgi:hypothetical protein